VRPVAGALAVLVALGLAGCGDGGLTSHGAFVHDAARICRTANASFTEIDVVRLNAERAVAVLEQVLTIGDDALDDLRALKPPTDAQRDVEAWLGLLDQALDEVGYARDRLVDDQLTRALDAAVRADLLTRRAQTLAREVGLDRVCRVPRLLP